MSYVNSKEAQEFFQVSDQTLRRWAKNGQIKFKITPGGHRRFYISNDDTKKKIIYCRVSSAKQKDDLKRQTKFMQNKFPNYEIMSDIGSGINFKRKQFITLLQQIFNGDISKVVVASNDRLVRFNYDFFEWLFKQFGCRLVCVNKEIQKSPEQELSEDLISIITVFAAKFHGKRKYDFIKKNKNFSM